MGFVMLGISTLTTFGINAALFGMVAHGLITGMLFFLAGSVKHRFHTLEITRLGGMLIQMPKLGWILGFCAMASLGLPGLAGFWGEFPAILSAYSPAFGLSGAAVPHADGARRDRHGVRRGLPAVAVPAHGVRHRCPREWTDRRARRPRRRRRRQRRAPRGRHPRRHRHRVDRLDADARPDPRPRRLPAAAVQDLRPGRPRASSTTSAGTSAVRDRVARSPRSSDWAVRAADDRLARHRARARSSSSASTSCSAPTC